jgi:hypothetical protein
LREAFLNVTYLGIDGVRYGAFKSLSRVELRQPHRLEFFDGLSLTWLTLYEPATKRFVAPPTGATHVQSVGGAATWLRELPDNKFVLLAGSWYPGCQGKIHRISELHEGK